MSRILQDEPRLAKKALWTLIHGIERRLSSDNFIVSNRTPYELIHQDGIMSVRRYLALEADEIRVGDATIPVRTRRYKVPVVLVPPLAATAAIFDLLPQRSLVRYFLACGFDVYLVDWGAVEAKHHGLSLENYVLEWLPAALGAIRERSGEPELSMFGYCMGGLLSLMYAAASQDRQIRNMVTVASPVDMHQVGIAGRVLSLVHKPVQIVSQVLNVSLLDLPAQYLHLPGWFNSLVFKLTNPVGSVSSSLDLLVNLWDREYVKEHTTMSQWFDKMVDYPGETIKGMVVHMGLNNGMARGRMRLGGKDADFKQIRCPILAFAGESDKLVKPRSAHKVLDIVSSEDKQFYVVPGGHAGVFAGGQAPENTWAISADWLAARSD